MNISLKEIFRTSWKQVKANYKFLIPLFLIAIVISFALSFEGDDIFSLSGIISLLITPLLYFVVTKVSLYVARNEKIGFHDLFKGFNQRTYLLFLAINIFMSIALMLLIGLGVFVAFLHPIIGSLVSLAVLVVVSIICIGVIFFPQFRLIDVGSSFWPTIKDSFILGKGNRVLLIKFVLIAFVLNIVGALLLGIGLLVTLPITTIALAHIYEKIKIIK